MPWIETVTVMAPELEIEDPEDDLNRETLFYNLTLHSVKEGRKQLEKLKIKHRRPDDFFAEMLKSDDHMKKVSTASPLRKSSTRLRNIYLPLLPPSYDVDQSICDDFVPCDFDV